MQNWIKKKEGVQQYFIQNMLWAKHLFVASEDTLLLLTGTETLHAGSFLGAVC